MTTLPTTAARPDRVALRVRGARGLLADAARVRALMLWGGASLLPLGLLVIILGWYGIANTPYQYDQMSYLVSGGLLGLGLTLVGGFLFFGAWLAQIAQQGQDSSDRLTEALLALAAAQGTASPATSDDRLVTAGKGTTLHRSDCGLVQYRPDLVPAPDDLSGLSACRVCRPLEP